MCEALLLLGAKPDARTDSNATALHFAADRGATLVAQVLVDGRNTATHCNTLQHTATYCNTLQHTAAHDSVLQHSATHCNTLQHTATHCNTPGGASVNAQDERNNTPLHLAATHTTHCNTLQHTATHYNTMQHTATCCNTLQHTAPH